MYTRFILVGGYPGAAADGGRALCETMVRGPDQPVKILICLFAREAENWEASFKSDMDFLQAHVPNTELKFLLARPEEFIAQVQWSDVLYIKGGEANQLIKTLSQMPRWQNELAHKTIVGTSAGAEALCQYYYHVVHRQVEEGLGVLQSKLIPHWQATENFPEVDWDTALHELESYKERLPIIQLREGEFITITI